MLIKLKMTKKIKSYSDYNNYYDIFSYLYKKAPKSLQDEIDKTKRIKQS